MAASIKEILRLLELACGYCCHFTSSAQVSRLVISVIRPAINARRGSRCRRGVLAEIINALAILAAASAHQSWRIKRLRISTQWRAACAREKIVAAKSAVLISRARCLFFEECLAYPAPSVCAVKPAATTRISTGEIGIRKCMALHRKYDGGVYATLSFIVNYGNEVLPPRHAVVMTEIRHLSSHEIRLALVHLCGIFAGEAKYRRD